MCRCHERLLRELARREDYRNIRVAGFGVLKNLGELQMVIDYRLTEESRLGQSDHRRWGRVLLVKDLA